MVITPTSKELVTKPGQSVSTDIQVENQNTSTEHLKATIYTFAAHGEDGTPILQKPTASDTFINWASLSTTQFDAEPSVFTTVKLTIAPPATAAFGYYYAIIVSRNDRSIPTLKAANLQGAVASLILLDVQAPGEKRLAAITSFSTNHNTSEFLPVSFNVRMHNTGNVHVAPIGAITIRKGNKLIATLPVNGVQGEILPDSYRVYTASWSEGTPVYKQQMKNGAAVLDKNGKPITKLDWSNFNLSKLRFGHYTAKLVMAYSDGHVQVTPTATLSFWVIPWRVLGFGALALIIVIAGLYTLVWRPFSGRLKQHRDSSARRR